MELKAMLLNNKISALYPKVRKQVGSIGIEIESEFSSAILDRLNDYLNHWSIKGDGSLRNFGYEFVLNRPADPKDLDTVLKEWQNFITKAKVKYLHSNRCSIHIHNNIQDFTVVQTITAICAYWLIEPYLMAFCGDARKGNNFCLTLRDADGVHTQLIKNIKSGNFLSGFDADHYRYASLNPESIYKFGSIEVRTMRGTDDIKEIKDWANINYEIFNNSKKFKDPQDLMNQFNQHGAEHIYKTLLSSHSKSLLEKVNQGKSPSDLIEENALYVLEVAEARESWDAKLESEEKKDIERKVIQLKLDYLLGLGFVNDDGTRTTATYLARKDLIANHNFNQSDFVN
jgi:hypothetical protein